MLEITQKAATTPVLILIDRQISGVQPEKFCRWCTETFPSAAVMLLESAQTDISHEERQMAIAYGAVDILPAFQADNLALKGIAGIKKVVSALGGLAIDNDALVSCLLALKQDLETSPSLTQFVSSTTPNPVESAIAPDPQPQLRPIATPTNPPDKSRQKRVYRGRVY
ncbi:hypothetical protein [Roseofilum casamattae]|uniref:Uncharacterized protein n=1 Tax=Roseofilum casamattae BLCC-M143 TaxID=3022442 RepID=A0ABT7BTN9_9CYAN|nr:hypothetical protein [Roseofilum casamattae]MDJ1182548.1 hypothetical protein [Roseofilum casamattae BLCC-M143]